MVAILLALKLAVKAVLRLVMIDVVQVAKLDVQRIALPHVERAMVSVLPDVGTLVLVPQMPTLLSVELVTMGVHIAMVPHHMDRVTVHGAVQRVKTAVHLIAVSHALKLSKAF